LNLLINAGRVKNRIAKLCWEHQIPLVGSSANKSLSGSKYSVKEIEKELLDIAELNKI